ncbi:MAG: hypothetical protein ACKVP0_24210 [Pirellulaceae bacterium]
MARLVELYRVRFYGLAVLLALGGVELAEGQAEETASPVVWRAGYREAIAQAKADKTLAVLWFYDPREQDENDKFAAAVLNDSQVQKSMAGVALAKLPLDAAVAGSSEKEPSVVLLEHAAFAEMLHKPGLAIIDMRDEKSPHYHRVVSVYPFVRQPISCEGLIAMLDLPSGSLTQRTLIWAVRTHSDRPQSAASDYSSYLAAQAESHSQHQASIHLQGHHNWDQRFQEINVKLGGGMVSREVCAESWPNQRLVEAAEECVHSWRQSSGHWEGVSGKHASFGYDMKLGTNGIWYATGIFGDRR